jgi:hypothetical protein
MEKISRFHFSVFSFLFYRKLYKNNLAIFYYSDANKAMIGEQYPADVVRFLEKEKKGGRKTEKECKEGREEGRKNETGWLFRRYFEE